MATRASRPTVGLIILTVLCLMLSLVAFVRPSVTLAATATVDGRVTASDGYSKFADLFAEKAGEPDPVQVATVWWTQDDSYLYFALEMNALGDNVVNENVYAASGPQGGPPTCDGSDNFAPDYHATFDTGWGSHSCGELLRSDAASFGVGCGGTTIDRFVQDYFYSSNGTWRSDHLGGDGALVFGSGPVAASSSMVWNATNGGFADWTFRSPDFDATAKYPTPAAGTPAAWVWEMTYEFKLNRANYLDCGPITFSMPTFQGESGGVGGMHNSAAKEGFSGNIIIPPVAEPSVSITKTPDNGAVNAGDPIEFTITVSNGADAGDAVGLVISDHLPAGFSWTSNRDDVCDITAHDDHQDLSCAVPTLVGGASFAVEVSAVTDGATTPCGLIQNTATVSGGSIAEKSDSGSITVECPLIRVEKTPDAEDDVVVDAGDPARFTITVTNDGAGTATGVTLADTLPSTENGWAIASSEWPTAPATGSCVLVADELDCGPVDLPAGQHLDVVVETMTTPTDCGDLINLEAVANSTNGGSDTDGGQLAVECAGLNLQKTANADLIDAGETASYTITVWNTGPGTAFDVVIEDEIPAGWSFDDGGACDALASSVEAGAETEGWSCTIDELPAVDDMTEGIEIVVSGPTTHDDCGLMTNTAFASSSSSNDELERFDTILVRCPTLVLDKEADAELITIALDADGTIESVDPEVVTWTLTYTLTNGPVTNAVITDELPTGLVYVHGSASDGGLYDEATNTLTWTFATLSESGSVTYEAEIDPETISRTAPTVNVAVISSDQTPEDEGEDQISVTVEQELGGNPTPTPTPNLPDTAVGIGIDGTPVTVPVELLVAFSMASLGAMALANVRAARRRRR